MSELSQPHTTALALSKHGRNLEPEKTCKYQRQHYLHHPPQQFLHQYYMARNPTDGVAGVVPPSMAPPQSEAHDQGLGGVGQAMARPMSQQRALQAPLRGAPVPQIQKMWTPMDKFEFIKDRK
jgi:hypothetical protein